MESIALYWGALLIAYFIATRTKNKEKLSRLTLDALNIIMYLLILMERNLSRIFLSLKNILELPCRFAG